MGSVVGVLHRVALVVFRFVQFSVNSITKPRNQRLPNYLAVDFQCKMSVIGIDIGNENSYIAVARAGGIETIANEYSQRATPTYIAFGEKTRDLGVSAKNKQITNLKNTIFGFKRLIGRKFRDPIVQSELEYLPYNLCELKNGDIGIKVVYLQEQTVLTVQQVMAMMLTKIKDIAEHALEIKVQDCVICVPVFFTDCERRALLDAAEIAGLNPLKLVNETAAVSLAYGFYKQDLSDDKPKNVVFVDLGNSMLQISACALTNNKLKVIASIWNRNLGGRDFDNALVKYFVDDFKVRYKLDASKNGRALMRLMQECEKLKKQMSANSLELPLNIECFMDDKDVTGRMKRELFEKLCEELLKSIEVCMRKILVDANLKLADIDSVQIVGGSSRLPSVKNLVKKVFGKEPSTSLNQDEAVARGCALQCAMLSPTFKVRDFAMSDIQPYPISIAYKIPDKAEKERELVFTQNHAVPYSHMLNFWRSEPFTIEAMYTGNDLSYGNPQIGSFVIQGVTPTPENETKKVKAKVRINKNGIFTICSAVMVEQHIQTKEEVTSSPEKVSNEEQIPKSNSDDAMDNEPTPPNGDLTNMGINEKNETKEENGKKDSTKKTKIVSKHIELPIVAHVPQLSKHELMDLIEKENKMITQDKMEKEKADAKNAVEEYVYDMRGKLCDAYEKFISNDDREKFMKFLEDTENWLYEDGEDQQKSVYCKKLSDLKEMGDPVVCRYNEWQQRPSALNDFGLSLQLVYKALDSYVRKEEQYSHIEEEEMNKVRNLWQEKESWLGQYSHIFSKLQPHENPPITALQLRQEREGFENILRPILNKPKPKVEPPPSEPPPSESPASGGDNNCNAPTDSEMSDANTSQNPVNPSKDQNQSNEQMETN